MMRSAGRNHVRIKIFGLESFFWQNFYTELCAQSLGSLRRSVYDRNLGDPRVKNHVFNSNLGHSTSTKNRNSHARKLLGEPNQWQ
jgi:hypothetical protein